MSTLQESLKASSGIDVKNLLENITGKPNLPNDFNQEAIQNKSEENK